MPPAAPTRLRPTRLAAVAACALGGLASCGGEAPVDPWTDVACEAALKKSDAVDALTWFKDPYGGPKRLGALSNDEGLAFAHKLDARGATRVVAVGVTAVKGAEPYERAEGLVVGLPDDPAKRLSLFELYARQCHAAGVRPRPDADQKYLHLPWGRDAG